VHGHCLFRLEPFLQRLLECIEPQIPMRVSRTTVGWPEITLTGFLSNSGSIIWPQLSHWSPVACA